jgi:glycosyltransferase EpsF
MRFSLLIQGVEQYGTNMIKRIIVNIYKIIMRFLIYISATRSLGCSKVANEYLYGKGWSRNKNIEVLYNGIDLSKYSHESNTPKNYLSNIISTNANVNFVTVGRIVAQKNPLFIVEVISELSKLRKDISLTWIGKGEIDS